jgi:hypothetical protein
MSSDRSQRDALDALEAAQQRALGLEDQLREKSEIIHAFQRELSAAQDQVREFTRLALGRSDVAKTMFQFPQAGGGETFVAREHVLGVTTHPRRDEWACIWIGPGDAAFFAVEVSPDEVLRRLGFVEGSG